MKHRTPLLSLLLLGTMTFALAACDNKQDENAQSQEQSAVPAAEDTAAVQATPAATIEAEGASAFATAEGATTGAVFLTLHNTGAESDSLVGVKTDKAQSAELHETSMDANGTMQMRKVDGIDITAGQMVQLKSDGYHIMLMQPVAPLTQGETFNVTLEFAKAAPLSVAVTVVAPGGDADMSHDHDAMTPAPTGTTETAPAAAITPDNAAPAPAEVMAPAETPATPAPDSVNEQPAD